MSTSSSKPFNDAALLRAWDQKLEEGLFRSSHKTAVFRMLGDNFYAQYNEAQASAKRGAGQYAKPPPPPPVCAPFNPDKFNFLKANTAEILMRVKIEDNKVVAVAADDKSAHPIFCNVSPLTPGHFLLVPFMELGLPQVLTREAVELGIYLVAASSRTDMRKFLCKLCNASLLRSTTGIIFNGMGGWASVNHLHLQGVYLEGLHISEVAHGRSA